MTTVSPKMLYIRKRDSFKTIDVFSGQRDKSIVFFFPQANLYDRLLSVQVHTVLMLSTLYKKKLLMMARSHLVFYISLP